MMEDDIHATLNSIQRELMSMREENFNLSKKLMREKLKSKHIRQHKNQSSEENLWEFFLFDKFFWPLNRMILPL